MKRKTMFCRYCGQRLPEDADFCSACGRKTKPEPAAMQQRNESAPQPSYYGSVYQTPNERNGYYKPPQKKKGKVLLIVLAAILALGVWGLFSEEDGDRYDDYIPHSSYNSGVTEGSGIYSSDLSDSGLRNFYTNIKGDGSDKATIMVYMVGSDLESVYGCATDDLQEMIDSGAGQNVNIVVQTGGTEEWANSAMSDGECERWLIKNGEIYSLESLGRNRMLTSESLCDFVRFAASNYPANRYMLIFWDHGGGSVYGFGYDEVYPDDSLYLPDIAEGLKNAGVKFDFVGFDACLMANIETAYMLEPYADYMIASEETEPAEGWYYTDWLKDLDKNPGIDTVALGVKIVDNFVKQNDNYQTLSVVSLREVPRIYDKLNEYMANANEQLFNKNYSAISTARANAKAYADGEYDLIDMVDFVKNLDVVNGNELVDSIRSAVKYRNDCQTKGSCGLSMYFPYTDLYSYSYARSFFESIGYSGKCYDFFNNFVNIMAGGKIDYEGKYIEEVLVAGNAQNQYNDYDWYDQQVSDDFDYTASEFVMPQAMYINGQEVLPLTDNDWENITNVEVQAWVDDGEGYVDLGSDQYYETDDDGNIILSFDRTWVSLNDVVVAYYSEGIQTRYDGTNVFTGYVPAVLNDDTYIEIMLKYDDDNPYGYVEGYRLDDSDSTVAGRDLFQFKQGDEVYFIYDYYDYMGNYVDSYIYEDMYIDAGGNIEVGYTDLEDSSVVYWYMVKDIYQNSYWTNAMFLD